MSVDYATNLSVLYQVIIKFKFKIFKRHLKFMNPYHLNL